MPDPVPVTARRAPWHAWSDRTRQVVGAMALGLAAFAACEVLLIGRPLNRFDEAWMLWVGARLARGDVLYRDVYDVSTPIAAWLVGLGEWIFGTHLVVTRTLSSAVFATEVVLACSVGRAFGAGRVTRGGIALALLAFASPVVVFVNLYSAIAVLGGLVAFRSIVGWLAHRDDLDRHRARVALAATAAGIAVAFWSKPNLGGFFGLAVVAVVVVAGARRPRTRILVDGAWLAAVFAVIAVPFVVAIAATGAWSSFVGQVFLSKGQYVDVGFSYFSSLQRRVDDLIGGGPHGDLRAVVPLLTGAAPITFVLCALVGAWRARRSGDLRVVAAVGFVVAGLFGVLPRPGANHIAGTMPVTLAAAAGLWALVPVGSGKATLVARRMVAAALVVVVAFAAVVVVADGLDATFGHHHRWSAPFAPAERRRPDEAAMARLRRGLERHTDGTVFIAREDGGYLYLITGTRNPLPYDIVERSDLGSAGVVGLIGRLRRGDARFVCIHPPFPDGSARNPLHATRLDRWVRDRFTPVASLPSCDLYAAPPRRVRLIS